MTCDKSMYYATYKSNKIDTFIRDEVKQAIFDNGGVAIGILPTEDNINYCEHIHQKVYHAFLD